MLERDSSQNNRSTHRSNADYREQLNERNTLLQEVYQTVDKITGTDKVSDSVSAMSRTEPG
jgi:hypothetical protein